ncbi:MAG: RsmE family RNA methyltransferase [Bacteroidetes bacterium]|jgi:16S rRNA (uracil1498-N3)-methyltransferase|nr:RsmE family RNA methyltransferase [Bacteroidota bacterium]
MVTYFYASPSAFRGAYVTLPPDEAAHARKVLRTRAGDTIAVVDGQGGWYQVAVDVAAQDHLAGQVVASEQAHGEPPYQLTLAVGLLKQRNRWETLLEKCTELGVHAILPLTTDHGEKATLRRARCERVLVAAMKQSKRSWLPALHDPLPALEALQQQAGASGLIATMDAPADAHPLAVLQGCSAGPLTAFIGPEAGFSTDERAEAQALGYTPVSLGRRRLRAETAAMTITAACALAFP